MSAIASDLPHSSYHPVSKMLHWITAALIVTLYVLIWVMDENNKPLEEVLVNLHKSVGVTVWFIVVGRLIWRLTAGVPMLPSDMPGWQRGLAKATHYLLYALIFAQPLIGFTSSNLFNSHVPWFGLFNIPPVFAPDTAPEQAFAKQVFGYHELVGNVLMYLVLFHTLAALYHHYVRKDHVLRGMLPGGRN